MPRTRPASLDHETGSGTFSRTLAPSPLTAVGKWTSGERAPPWYLTGARELVRSLLLVEGPRFPVPHVLATGFHAGEVPYHFESAGVPA